MNTLMGYKNLYELVTEIGKEVDSLYSGSRHDKANILGFMDVNEWFGVKHVMKDLAPWIAGRNVLKIQDHLRLWLSAYKKSDREKATLLLQRFKDVYPDTCRLYHRFLTERELWDAAAPWKLLDFLFSEINKDITKYGEDDMEDLIKNVNANATRVTARLFAGFLENAHKNGEPLSRWGYTFGARDAPERVNHAYSFTDFSAMAYCVFNSGVWVRQGMVEKAAGNKAYADLWLFIALHFICALRKGDMERLPAPALPYSPEITFEKILSGTFEKQSATALTEELTLRLKLKSMKPSKTAKHGDVPELKLFVPESLQEPLGIIIALVLAHHPEIRAGEGFVTPDYNLENIRRFFGKRFEDAIGNRRFSSRRGNKSYLQGIEITGDDEPGKPKGYMLAALARSHKSGLGKFAETTEVYLKDAKFSGYNPAFIIRQMFERGVFSFIPAALLEMYAGTEYVKMPIVSQTLLIGELGLTAYQVDGLVETVNRALIKTRKTVAAVIKSPALMTVNIKDMLQNIASGAAPGKQGGCLCLMTAAGLPCPYPGRKVCICCGYEIYTKMTMRSLMCEYSHFMNARDSAGPNDAFRYDLILNQAIFPAVEEMLVSAKLLYPNADTSGLSDIVEIGMGDDNGDDGARNDSRQLQPVYIGS